VLVSEYNGGRNTRRRLPSSFVDVVAAF